MPDHAAAGDHACSLPSTHDKYNEAQYFFGKLVALYHRPDEFKFNLNAFIQAIRNITFMLQSEERKPEGFAQWYAKKQEEMRADDLLRRFVEARNIIVKRSSLVAMSTARSGLFRGRMLKLAAEHEVPPFTDTVEVLERAKNFALRLFLDEEHSAIGEQAGVERTWVVSEISQGEVTTDGLFSLQRVECLGSCGTAPLMQISDAGYAECLTKKRTDALLEELKRRGDGSIPENDTPTPVFFKRVGDSSVQITADGQAVGGNA